jgi:type VI secretion system protein ImpL
VVTDEAVLLDTAGRYTTQDSDRIADGEGWSQFLQLLKRHRRRRPINGSSSLPPDLLTRSPAEFDADLMAIRQRAAELNRGLGIDLPVYLLVTKVDLIAGFREYFDDLDAAGRRQVWGTTLALDDSRSGRALRTLPAEFDALVERLNAGINQRLRDERDPRRRSLLYGFPQQFAALKTRLLELVDGTFRGSEQDRRLFLRGVYLTSGTQEGTPIDRLLGSLGRAAGLGTDGRLAPKPGAYFIEHRCAMPCFRGVSRGRTVAPARRRPAACGVRSQRCSRCSASSPAISFGKNRAYRWSGRRWMRLRTRLPEAEAARCRSSCRDALKHVVEVASHDGQAAPWSMRSGLPGRLWQGRARRVCARAERDPGARSCTRLWIAHRCTRR